MGILDRMSRLIRANVNDMIDRAEDPEKMLNELLREMDSSMREARVQVANMIAQEKEIEADLQAASRDAREWERRAELAVQNEKDDLAREALRRKRDAEQISDVYTHQLSTQQEVVATLKQQLTVLEAKFREAESKRSVLIARHRATSAQRTVTETLSNLPGLDSQSELARMERRIRSEESKTSALREMQGSNLEFQFAELDRDDQIEDELAALKSRNTSDTAGRLTSGTGDSSSGSSTNN
jgi:phage shock protein A